MTKVDKTCSLSKLTLVAHIFFYPEWIVPDCAKTRGETRHWHGVKKIFGSERVKCLSKYRLCRRQNAVKGGVNYTYYSAYTSDRLTVVRKPFPFVSVSNAVLTHRGIVSTVGRAFRDIKLSHAKSSRSRFDSTPAVRFSGLQVKHKNTPKYLLQDLVNCH